MNDYLPQIAGLIGLSGYVVLFVGLLKTKIEQSFAAFMLWAMLDIIATITTILEEGNYWLALGNAAGSTAITGLLVIKKQVSWSWIETMTALLVLVCLVIWFTTGEKAGLIASSLAVIMASVPQLVATYKKPWTTPTAIYVVFLIAAILSFIAGKSWTIEQRFYSGCAVFLCSVIVLFSLRKAHKSVLLKTFL
ncbi:hypothetical protein [Spirosoma arcticum]